MKTTKLEKINACRDAREWVATQKNYKEAWQNCERGDWMNWIAKMLGVDDRKLTLVKAKQVNQVRHLMKDQRSIAALDAAEKYGNGEITRDELNTSAAAADAAACAAAVYASADAAYYAAVDAAYYAAAAAYYAATADADAAAAARKKSLKMSADFCREILTEEVFAAYKNI